MFADDAIDPYDFGPTLSEVVADYIQGNSPLTVELEGRITRLDDAAATLAAIATPAPEATEAATATVEAAATVTPTSKRPLRQTADGYGCRDSRSHAEAAAAATAATPNRPPRRPPKRPQRRATAEATVEATPEATAEAGLRSAHHAWRQLCRRRGCRDRRPEPGGGRVRPQARGMTYSCSAAKEFPGTGVPQAFA